MHSASVIAATFAATCVLLMVLSLPLILGRVPRNIFYGIRTRRSMQGTQAEWYAINRKGGWILFWSSLAVLCLIVLFVVS